MFYSFPMLGLSIFNELWAAEMQARGDANAPPRLTDVPLSDLRTALQNTQLDELLAVMSCGQMEEVIRQQSHNMAVCNDMLRTVSARWG